MATLDQLLNTDTGLNGATNTPGSSFTGIKPLPVASNLLSAFQIQNGAVPGATLDTGISGAPAVKSTVPGSVIVPYTPPVVNAPVVKKTVTTTPTSTAVPPAVNSGGLTPAQAAAADAAATPQMQFLPGTGNPNPTYVAPGSVNDIYTYNITPEEKAARDASSNYVNTYSADANQTIDPSAIYRENLDRFQAQIDATNKLYNDQLNQARIQGQGRIESRQFSQGRSGQIGSGTGEAGINSVQDANTKVEDSIRAEQNLAIQGILGKVSDAAVQEQKDKTAAKKAGADALLTFYDNAPTRKAAALKPVIATLLSKGIDPSTLSTNDLNSITSGLGVSKEDVISSYKQAVADKAKADAEAAKTANQALPASAQEYEYAKKSGYKGSYTQYQNEDANRKAIAAKIANPTIGEQNATTVGNISKLFAPGATIPNSGGTPFVDANGFATPEGFKTAQAAAAADGLSRKDFIVQFGYTIPTGFEASFGLTPAEIKILTGALPTN